MLRHLWVALVGWSGVAHAGDVGVLSVFDERLTGQEERTLLELVATAVDQLDDVHAVTLSELRTRLGARTPEVLRDVVSSAAVAEAQALAARPLEEEDATEALEALRDQVAAEVAWSRSVAPLRTVEALLAMRRAALGDDVGSRALLYSVAALAPDGGGWPATAPSEEVAAWYATEVAMLAEEEAEIAVEGTGSVWLDGVLAGQAPITLHTVPATHHVHLRDDARVGYRVVTVGPDERYLARISVGPPTLGSVGPEPAARAQALTTLVDVVGHAGSLDEVLVLGQAAGGVYAQRYDVATGVFSEPLKVGATADPRRVVATAAALWSGPIGEGGAPVAVDRASSLGLTALLSTPPPVRVEEDGLAEVAPALPLEARLEREPVDPRKKKVGMWVGIGVGIAAAAVIGTAVGVTLAPDPMAPPVSGTIRVSLPRGVGN